MEHPGRTGCYMQWDTVIAIATGIGVCSRTKFKSIENMRKAKEHNPSTCRQWYLRLCPDNCMHAIMHQCNRSSRTSVQNPQNAVVNTTRAYVAPLRGRSSAALGPAEPWRYARAVCCSAHCACPSLGRGSRGPGTCQGPP